MMELVRNKSGGSLLRSTFPSGKRECAPLAENKFYGISGNPPNVNPRMVTGKSPPPLPRQKRKPCLHVGRTEMEGTGYKRIPEKPPERNGSSGKRNPARQGSPCGGIAIF